MSDWLERELTRGLAPVAAPEALRIRLGLAPVRRRVFPRVALTVAAAVVFIIGASVAAGRTAALDLRSAAGVDVVRESAADVRLVRCDGGAGLPVRVQVPTTSSASSRRATGSRPGGTPAGRC